jgi:hypothetical protein
MPGILEEEIEGVALGSRGLAVGVSVQLAFRLFRPGIGARL